MKDDISKYTHVSTQVVTPFQNEVSTSDNNLQHLPKKKNGEEARKIYIFNLNCVNGL